MRFWIIVAALIIADAISPHWIGNRSLPTFLILLLITAVGLFLDSEIGKKEIRNG